MKKNGKSIAGSKCRKIRSLLAAALALTLLLTGCGQTSYTNAYSVYSSDFTTGSGAMDFFANQLCVAEEGNQGTSTVNSTLAGAAICCNLTDQTVTYKQNIYQKMYPASTTKVLTAYIILRYCDLDDMVTVSYNAANPDEESSVCGLNTGDVISVRELLYGLLLMSGNDAAIALAEHCAGSVSKFADLMNEEAAELGATHSHFMNPAGLPDPDHYTTVYDMYLIFQKALTMKTFTEIIGTAEHQASYTNQAGEAVTKDWENTCRYITGANTTPEGFTVLGGKTGTTKAAGYCLVLYSENSSGDKIVSIVYKGISRADMYHLMSEILTAFAK